MKHEKEGKLPYVITPGSIILVTTEDGQYFSTIA